MALFGLQGEPEPTLDAVRAGLEMLETVTRLQPYFENLFHRSFTIRVGIHFGSVVVGNVGFGSSQQLTVIGDAVNFASRVEAANKKRGTHLLLSKVAYQEVKGQIEVRKLHATKIPGKSGRHILYEVLPQSIG